MTNRVTWIVLIALGFAALACNMPGIGGGAGPDPAVEVPVEAVDPVDPTATAAEAVEPTSAFVPAGEATAAPAEPAGEVSNEIVAPPNTPAQNATYEGISFYVDYGALASEWLAETRLATDPQGPGAMPSHYYFSFNDYVHADSFYTPGIWVIPTENFEGFGSGYDSVPADLGALLADNRIPADDEMIPFLPGGAGEVFRAQVGRLQFQDGRGFRFITERAQALVPVSNEQLFYTFQGLTWDGEYYIAAILPVRNNIMQQLEEEPDDSIYADGNAYRSYVDSILADLELVDPDSFTPTIDTLDTLIGSIQIER